MQSCWSCWVRSVLTAPGCRPPTRRTCHPRRRTGGERHAPSRLASQASLALFTSDVERIKGLQAFAQRSSFSSTAAWVILLEARTCADNY